ncbi:MAG TPA: hypothetical protein VMV69_19295 [Pirellulales bacterium]|nr:hypothetical protein [Pirellulales bacterium]
MNGALAFGRVWFLGWFAGCVVTGVWARAQEADIETTFVADVGDAPARFDEALARITSVEFTHTPLAEALASLGKRHDVPFLIEPKGLEVAGLDAHATVTLAVRGVPLASVLALMFRPLDLNWTIGDGVLLVTARSEAENLMETKVYPVATLLAAADESGLDAARLKEVISNNLSPETWDETGGPGSMASLADELVISAERRVHAQIAALLLELRRAYGLATDDGETISPSLAAVRRALAAQVAFEFDRPTLREMIDAIKKESAVQIFIDKKAIADAGHSAESPIPPVRLAGVTLAAALTQLLLPIDLTWIVRDDVLCITTKTEAENALTTKVYLTQGLFAADHDPATQNARLLAAITTTIVPESWDETGGPGTISAAPRLLVVSQTREVHERIDDLFDQLRATRKVAAGGSPAEGMRQVVYRAYGVSSNDLILAIQSLVEPASWNESGDGGHGTILVVRGETGNGLPPQPTLLIIRQTSKGHRQIEKLLRELGQGRFLGGMNAMGGMGMGGGMF